MRQLFAIVLIALVAAASAQTNCSMVKRPAEGANFYMPPEGCMNSEPALKACGPAYETCVKAQPAACSNVPACFDSYLKCVTLTPINASSANCSAWATSLNNFELYLAAGGSYNGSLLERACAYTACSGAMSAMRQGVMQADGTVCPVDVSALCTAPNFDPVTRAPNQPSFTMTFGGNWDNVDLTDKNSAVYKQVESALQKGIAKLVGVAEFLVTILAINKASLKVEFLVNDPNVSADSIKSSIDTAIAGGNVGTFFTELATVDGAPAIEVTGLEVADPATPAPPTSASSVAVMMAVLMVVAAMLF